jgi:hypothetical protein
MDKAQLYAPACWLDALDQSQAELAAGETVSSADVLRDLHEGIARIEAKILARPTRETARPG